MKSVNLFLLLLVSNISVAQTVLKQSEKTLSQKIQQKIFTPQSNECSITRFSLLTRETESRNSFGTEGIFRATAMSAVVETSQLPCLTDFVVVQYIHGCAYSSDIDRDTGAITERINQNREYRGNSSFPFKHPQWVVDTTDADPMYSSNGRDPEIEKRLNFLRYPKSPLQLKNTLVSIQHDLNLLGRSSNYSYFQEKAPTTPLYFVKDLPSMGNYSVYRDKYSAITSQNIQNISLEFKTCVYRTKDVPRTGDPTAEPLQCFEWKHQQIFNYQTKEFESPADIAPICLK